jgi:hypothetical protein
MKESGRLQIEYMQIYFRRTKERKFLVLSYSSGGGAVKGGHEIA